MNAPRRDTEPVGAFSGPDASTSPYVPGAPQNARAKETYPNYVRLVLLLAVLWMLLEHELFHFLADGVGMGYDNALGFLWGPGPVGLVKHVALFFGLVWVWLVAWRGVRARWLRS